ncbi:hypothetical protein RF11_04213 [Thelohanellus kitauei]|uniref:Uncharacterized protein n=1 Tax=Thelohanellus kitauei TaxID=669202 RepID=A0A0C2JIF4_THEKT|nr:hypothetical protein RF11_04213 [Thelohanellus kitauei]
MFGWEVIILIFSLFLLRGDGSEVLNPPNTRVSRSKQGNAIVEGVREDKNNQLETSIGDQPFDGVVDPNLESYSDESGYENLGRVHEENCGGDVKDDNGIKNDETGTQRGEGSALSKCTKANNGTSTSSHESDENILSENFELLIVVSGFSLSIFLIPCLVSTGKYIFYKR